MKTVLSVFLCICLMQAVFVLAEDEHVLVLTDSTFDESLNSNQYVLVEFYAPWCGHCKRLIPEWDAAAERLAQWAEENPELAAQGVKLAKVDCTVETEVAGRFAIQGYPTLKLFVGGVDGVVSDYNGGRERDEIFRFLVKKAQGAVQTLGDEAAFKAFSASDDGTGIVLVIDEEDENAEAYKKVATAKDDIRFAQTTSAIAGVDAPALLMFRSFADQATYAEDFPVTESLIVKFIEENAYDIVEEINQNSWTRLSSRGLPILIGVADFGAEGADGEEAAAFMKMLRAEAEVRKADVVISYGSKEGLGRAVEQFGGTGNVFPTVIGLLSPHVPEEKKVNLPERWSRDEKEELTPETFSAWIDTILAGEMKPFIKSEPIPEDNSGPVKVVVGDNFDALVKGVKHAFVEFYAPWCGHCKSLAPIWEELGQAYQDDDDVMIGKMDATANYVDPSFGVKGFPTLILFKDGEVVKNYDGPRALDDLRKFVEEQDSDDEDNDDDHHRVKDEL